MVIDGICELSCIQVYIMFMFDIESMTVEAKWKILTRPERIFIFQFFGGCLELSLSKHQQKVPKVHEQQKQCFVPHDHVVDHDDGQRNDGHQVHATIPEQRPLFQIDSFPGCKSGTRRHAQCVINGATHHCAYPKIRFCQKRSDDADKKFRRARGRRHERRARHVRRDAQVCEKYT